METVDWRTQLLPDSRQRIITKIMDTLKRHLPFSGEELERIAVRFEGKIYEAASSQSDYLRKISLKMLTMETKSLNPVASSVQSSVASTDNYQDTELKMATSIGSPKRKREHETDTTGTINVELIPKIQQLATRSKIAVIKNQLEEIVRDLYLLLNSSECLDTNKLILDVAEVITKHLSDDDDPKMKLMLKDDSEVFMAMKMQTWISLVNLGRKLL